MLSKTTFGLAAVAVMAGQAIAGNPRHQAHHVLHKKALDVVVDVTTVWTTITIDPPSSTSTTSKLQVQNQNQAQTNQTNNHGNHRGHGHAQGGNAVTTTTTLVAAVATPKTTTSTQPTKAAVVSVGVGAGNNNGNNNGGHGNGGAATVVVKTTTKTTPQASTPTPAPAPAPGGGTTGGGTTGGGSGKAQRGLAYNDPNLLSLFFGTGNDVQWLYNWGSNSDSSYTSQVPFCAMLWNAGGVGVWKANAQTAISKAKAIGKEPCLLSMNEPDNGGQANMSPDAAAKLHKDNMNQFSGQAKISTPAITNSVQPGEGIAWLKGWLSSCGGGCVFDAVAMHVYGVSGQGVLDQMLAVYQAAGSSHPIWLTEFKIADGMDEASELKRVLDQVDNNATFAFVEKLAYFWVAPGYMVSGSAVSNIGNIFAY